MQKNKGQSSWISLSDLMTGLMLVFMIIAVIMQDPMLCGNTKRKIHEALQEKFGHEMKSQSPQDKASCSLVITFQRVLFEKDEAKLSGEGKEILRDFLPKYIDVLQDTRFKEHIQEVRIEGHTGNPTPRHPEYIELVELSQKRARMILQYFVSDKAYQGLSRHEQNRLKFKLMANGFGNGRIVDKNGSLVSNSRKAPSGISRRVEFRIVTGPEQKPREVL